MNYGPDSFMAICNYSSGHASTQANDYGNYPNGGTAPNKTSEVAARVCDDGVNIELAMRCGLGRIGRVCASERQGHGRSNKCKLRQLQVGCACPDMGNDRETHNTQDMAR